MGVASLLIASTFGSIAASGYLGVFLQSTAAFIAAILAAILTVVIAKYTKGKYYLVREPNDITADDKID